MVSQKGSYSEVGYNECDGTQYHTEAQMLHIQSVLTELQSQRRHTQAELKRLDRAIAALRPLNAGNSGTEWGRKAKRTLSPAARRKIGAAQRARWAKLNKQKGPQQRA